MTMFLTPLDKHKEKSDRRSNRKVLNKHLTLTFKNHAIISLTSSVEKQYVPLSFSLLAVWKALKEDLDFQSGK